VIASGGTWWAVWNEPVEFGPTELFQAKTYGTDLATQRITVNPLADDAPSLARRPGGGAVLAWQRGDAFTPQPVDVWVATSADGAWASRPLATGGDQNLQPELFTAGVATFITWTRDGRVVEADNTSGVFRAHTFGTPGGRSRVAVSLGRVFVTWGTMTRRTFFAERIAGAWSGAYLSDSPREPWVVTAYAGKATVLMASTLRFFARTEQ
jgi:hypothetical protein